MIAGPVTKVARVLKWMSHCIHGEDTSKWRSNAAITKGSNMIVFQVDSLFFDFAGVVVAGFFIDPPTVGPFFTFAESEVIPIKHTGQEDRDENKDGCGSGNQSSLGD